MTEFLTRYKFAVGLGLVVLAATAFVLYRRSKQAEEPSLDGFPVSPYAAGAARGSGGGGGIVVPPGQAGLPAGGVGGDTGAGADPVSVGQATFAEEPQYDTVTGNLISQGIQLAPEGTTVSFQGTTYDVSGSPEFSPGNYNPNSPAGVLAMNKALAAAGMQNTQAGGSAIAPPPDIYTSDNEMAAAASAGGLRYY